MNPQLKKIADHNSVGFKTAQPLRAKRLRKQPELLSYGISNSDLAMDEDADNTSMALMEVDSNTNSNTNSLNTNER